MFAILPSADLDARALQARLEIVVESFKATMLFNPLMAVLCGVTLSLPHGPFGHVAPWRVVFGLAVELVCAGIAAYCYRRYRSIPVEEARAAERGLIAAQCVFSLGWGVLGFALWQAGNPMNHLFIAMTFAIIGFSMVFARAMHPPILFAAVLPYGAIFLVRLATGDSGTAHTLAVLHPFYIAFLMAMGLASCKRVDALIQARLANEDLAGRLAVAHGEALAKRYEAETANAAKSAFLANMSHELRTPLNAILGFSEIIGNQAMGREAVDRYSDYARDIHNSGAHLLSLINDLLDVAKIEAGKMEIDPKPLDVRHVVDSIGRIMGNRFADKEQDFSIALAPELPLLMADERALKQMLLNLVSNAAKFTPQGGNISITCGRPRRGGLQFCIDDNGPGISAEKLARVFQPFSQIDNRYDREAGGTGLGLALVQGLAQLHGGRAWLESEPGSGVRAFLYFPSTIEVAPQRKSA